MIYSDRNNAYRKLVGAILGVKYYKDILPLRESDIQTIERMLDSLIKKRASIIRSRFGLISGEKPQTPEAIGDAMGITSTAVGIYEEQAMCRLQNPERKKFVLHLSRAWLEEQLKAKDAKIIELNHALAKSNSLLSAIGEILRRNAGLPRAINLEAPLSAILNESIDKLKLSARAHTCLEKLDIKTIGELTQNTEAELLQHKYFGQKSLDEIKNALKSIKLGFTERK